MDLYKASLVNIPENLILEIFSYLSRKKLCQIARVCKQWHRITRDNILWRHVDIISFSLDELNFPNRAFPLQRMLKFLRSHFSEVVQTFKLRSDYSPDEKNSLYVSKVNLSTVMLKDLQGELPNLWTLWLHNCNLYPVSASSLPSSLHTLDLYWSYLPQDWFKPIETGSLKNLKVLKLSRCSWINMTDLEHISKLATLEVLDLGECYRVIDDDDYDRVVATDDALRVVAEKLTCLTELRISRTSCTDLALRHISRNLKNLKLLDLSKTGLSDAAVGSVISSLKNLKVLKLSCCSRISLTNLEHIGKVAALEVLDLSDCTSVTDDSLRVVAEKLTSLMELCIKGTRCTDLALRHISRNLKNLTLLDMSENCRLSDAAVASVASGLKNLVHLDISGCEALTDTAVNSVANNLKQLQLFHFCNTNTTCEPVRSFFIKMPKLRDIEMGEIDDVGLESLVPLQLVSLKVSVADVSDEGLSQIHKMTTLIKVILIKCASPHIFKGRLPKCWTVMF